MSKRLPSRSHSKAAVKQAWESFGVTISRFSLDGLRAFAFQAMKSVSEQTGRSMAQVALAWLRHRAVPVIPIIGARKVSQLQDNLASLDLKLSAEQLKFLDGASRIEPGFPQSIYVREMVRVIGYGGTWDRLLL